MKMKMPWKRCAMKSVTWECKLLLFNSCCAISVIQQQNIVWKFFLFLWHILTFHALLHHHSDGGDGGKSEIYSSVVTLKLNITFNGKPLTLMIETESRSGASIAFDLEVFPQFR